MVLAILLAKTNQFSYNFCSRRHISLKPVQICFIYIEKYTYLKPNKVHYWAVYFGIQIPIFLKYFTPIFLHLKHIQSITTVKQISWFCLHAIYLLELVFKRSSLFKGKHLDLRILYKF